MAPKKTDADGKTEPTKEYVAALDTMIEGRPTREGALIKGVPEEKLQAYADAGLIKEAPPATSEDAYVEATLAEGAARINTTDDKRTEK